MQLFEESFLLEELSDFLTSVAVYDSLRFTFIIWE